MPQISMSRDDIVARKRTITETSDPQKMVHSCFESPFLRRKTFRAGIAAVLVLIVYLALFLTWSLNDSFSIAGGAVGAASALFVVLNIAFVQGFNPSNTLLFWRTLCDLGLALRFLLIPAFNLYICGHYSCSRLGNNAADQSLCPLPSWMFEFFVVSSDCWFVCNGLELYTSITNPFSSFSSRIKKYHIFVWTTSLTISLIPFIVDQANETYGFWYISSYHDNSAICWLKTTDNNRLGLPFWFLFVVPLPTVYIFCIFTLLVAYQRLQKGLTRSFLPRLLLLVENTANVFISLLYWTVFYIISLMTFYSRNDSGPYNETMFNILMFTFGSKGLAAVIVWIFLVNINTSFSRSMQQNESLDANKALREEVLSFATSGIRSTAKAGHKLTPETIVTIRKPVNIDSLVGQNLITPYFFLRFLAGQMKQIIQLRDMVSRKKSSFNPSYVEQSPHSNSSLMMNRFPFMGSSLLGGTGTANNGGDQLEESEQSTDIPLEDKSRSSDHFGSGRDLTQSEAVIDAMDLEIGDTEDEETNTIKETLEGPSSIHPSSLVMGSASEAIARQPYGGSSGGGVGNVQNQEGTKKKKSQYVNAFLGMLGIDLDDNIEFLEFEPYHFRRLRIASGITDADYIEYFSTTIKERLTEGGASGAFFFFSKAEKFIAKSCTKEELETLRENAKAYVDYMIENPESFISQIYGIYQLRIYGNNLSFFVMNNLFYNDENITMNEKYDIKGSWVSRNAKPPVDGNSVTCSFCAQKFIYRKKHIKFQQSRSELLLREKPSNLLEGNSELGNPSNIQSFSSPLHAASSPPVLMGPTNSTSSNAITPELGMVTGSTHRASFIANSSSNKCPYTVNGQHEPNLILKDNDIKYKIRLSYENTVHLLRQIRSDVEFLFSLGIMDYSLLVGVHNTEYELKDMMSETFGSSEDPVRTSDGRSFDRSPAMASQTKTIRATRSAKDFVQDLTGIDDFPAETMGVAPVRKGSRAELKGKIKKLDVYKIVGPDCYFMGIIDFQQKWDWNKKLERFVKVTLLGKDPRGLSAIEPRQYKERFLRKIEDILDIESFLQANGPPLPPIRSHSNTGGTY